MSSKSGLWSVVACVFLAYVNVTVGPEFLAKQMWAFYDKPQSTLAPVPCMFSQCSGKLATCMADESCRKTAICCNKCIVEESESRMAACAYICEMTEGYENQAFIEVMKCFVGNGCLADYPRDGICVGENKDADQSVTSMDQIEGDWWVIGGVNCGQSEEWPGGYDNYPCQQERFINPSGKQWINNVTFCAGQNDKCVSDIIVTVANVSLPSPGVILVEYEDAPLSPQVEHWRIMSWPDHGDYMLVFWCGKLPILEYNGIIMISRKRNGLGMPEKYMKEFKKVAAKFDVDFDNICLNNNDNCPI